MSSPNRYKVGDRVITSNEPDLAAARGSTGGTILSFYFSVNNPINDGMYVYAVKRDDGRTDTHFWEHHLLPESDPNMSGAEEYEEIMKIQELTHGV